MRDNPIASIRRTTPVQEQRRSEPHCVNVLVQQQHQQGTDQRLLFPQPPTQQFQTPVVPTVETRNKHPLQRQSYLQRSSQDVRWAPSFQHPPPQLSQIQQHRLPQPPPIEVNEMGPTIQQGVIQHPGNAIDRCKTKKYNQCKCSKFNEYATNKDGTTESWSRQW